MSRFYLVTLTDGSDWRVRAQGRSDALRRARAGKGRWIGQYFTRIKRARARVEAKR